MVQLKRDTSGVDEARGFDIYDGPDPKKGVYPGFIQACTIRKASKTDNLYYNVLVIVDAPEGSPKAVYNGYPAWVILTMTDKDANLSREAAFYKAVCGKTTANVNIDGAAPKESGASNEVKVKTIGGKDPIGVRCRVDIRTEPYNGEDRPKPDTIYPDSSASDAAPPAPDDEPDDVPEDSADEAVDEGDAGTDTTALAAELGEMSLLKLKKAAVDEYGIPRTDLDGASKDDIVAAILDVVGGGDDETDAEEVDEAEPDPNAKPAYSEISSLALPKLRTWAANAGYEPKDLAQMSKDEILIFLVEEEVIGSEDDDPPF